jgi:type IV pilus assembly protein PilO
MAFSLLDKIQKVPPKTRAIAFGAFIGVVVVLYVWQLVIPQNTQIQRLEQSVADLQGKIKENDSKIKKLDELRAEVKSLQQRLTVLTEQLPPESEVSGLLAQIQGLVNKSGLTLKLWKPDKRKTHASGLYEEIPIALSLTGGYHNTATFFDRVSKLHRIVNILNIKMGSAKQGKAGAMDIDITCTAMTFAAVEKKVESPAVSTKKVQ